MQLVKDILKVAADKNATDIHLMNELPPVFRIKRGLERQDEFQIMDEETLNLILYYITGNDGDLEETFKKAKRLDLSFETAEYRYRINVSLAKGLPVFCIRLIKKGEIDIEKLGISGMIERMRKYKNGIILVTGKVNSGKSTTMNAFIQEINKAEVKKIISLEDPIEYVHEPIKSVIVQKEVSKIGDVNSFYEGLINVLREDSDIVVVGEIRDSATMQVAIELAESGQLVVGTLHTRSCGESIDRIINMYPQEEQTSIKFVLSNVLRLVVSQTLILDTNNNVLLIPEMMSVDTIISSIIRKDKLALSEIEDAIHTGIDKGSMSLEFALARLYNLGKIDMETIFKLVDKGKMERINRLIVQEQIKK